MKEVISVILIILTLATLMHLAVKLDIVLWYTREDGMTVLTNTELSAIVVIVIFITGLLYAVYKDRIVE